MKVLLVEDDPMIGENIQIALNGEGIATDWVKDGMAAESMLAARSYDAALLDLGIPRKDGTDVLSDLRKSGSNLPVLVITARDTIAQRVQGLNLGADDYLVKPFDLEELIARLHAVVRRARGNARQLYTKGNIVVDLTARQVLVSDQQVILSSREWMILEALATRPGAILSRDQLQDRLYGWSNDIESNAIEVYVHGLRKKLGAQFIVTVRGLGYMVEKN